MQEWGLGPNLHFLETAFKAFIDHQDVLGGAQILRFSQELRNKRNITGGGHERLIMMAEQHGDATMAAILVEDMILQACCACFLLSKYTCVDHVYTGIYVCMYICDNGFDIGGGCDLTGRLCLFLYVYIRCVYTHVHIQGFSLSLAVQEAALSTCYTFTVTLTVTYVHTHVHIPGFSPSLAAKESASSACCTYTVTLTTCIHKLTGIFAKPRSERSSFKCMFQASKFQVWPV
jgi:hypothetical protein